MLGLDYSFSFLAIATFAQKTASSSFVIATDSSRLGGQLFAKTAASSFVLALNLSYRSGWCESGA